MDLNELAKKELEEYEKKEKELKAQLAQIQKDKSATVKFLQAKGIMEVKKRGRRKKAGDPKS
jgi:ribosomal protein L29